MHVKLQVWRQAGPDATGAMETYDVPDISEEMSFLEMLDVVNERLNAKGREPIAFEHDCREGICGSCGMMINGQAHGPQKGTAACQLHMRKFADGDEIFIEPWRATAFPVLKDLIVDRSPFDRIVESGGFITAPTGAGRSVRSLKPALRYIRWLRSLPRPVLNQSSVTSSGACASAQASSLSRWWASATTRNVSITTSLTATP